MLDAQKNELHVGDEVIFIKNSNINPRLDIGKIEKIYENGSGCTVSGHSHVKRHRVMKTNTTQTDPLSLIKRIGYMQNDYDMCQDDEMTEELKTDIREFIAEFGISPEDMTQILQRNLTLAEIAVLLENRR